MLTTHCDINLAIQLAKTEIRVDATPDNQHNMHTQLNANEHSTQEATYAHMFFSRFCLM